MASTVWKGHLTFGLVSFPVRLYSAARSESISFNQLHKADGFARQAGAVLRRPKTSPSRAAKSSRDYEYEKDRYVVIEDEEVKKVAPSTAKVMEIQEFVKERAGGPDLFRNLVLHGSGRSGREAVRTAVRRAEAKRVTWAWPKSRCTIASTW